MRPSIYWGQLTVVDHAVILPNGKIIGNSFQLSAEVSADALNGEEQVVIDFSSGKKKIKAFVDGPEGLDHKLWAPLIAVSENVNKSTGEVDFLTVVGSDYRCTLPTDGVYITPSRLFDEKTFTRYHHTSTGQPFENWNLPDYINGVLTSFEKTLEEFLAKEIPGVRVKLTADHSPSVPVGATAHVPFRYVHGLPASTSYGCQNPIHGHLSYLALRWDDADNELPPEAEALETIVSHAYNFDPSKPYDYCPLPTYLFYNYTDSKVASNPSSVTVKFNTRDRGDFFLEETRLPSTQARANATAIIGLPDYTTVENLAQFFRNEVDEYLSCLELSGVNYTLWVSEGPNKGSSIKVSTND